MDVHQNIGRTEGEIVPDSATPIEETPVTGDATAKKSLPLWQAILLWGALGVGGITVATLLWVLVGLPFSLTALKVLLQGGLLLSVAGGILLYESIAVLDWRRLWRVAVGVLGGFLLVLGLVLFTWKWWVPTFVVEPIVEEHIQKEDVLPEQEVEATPTLPPEQEVLNIALFGVDQDSGSTGRSDALLIVSINKAKNKIKLTSLDRDSLVAIEGHGEEKLTHAWAYGQAKMAVKTLNQNFGMNITHYAYVNFTEFVGAIDYLGGVYVDVTAAERDHMNRSYNAWYPYYGYYIPKVKDTGRVLLKGAQALSYSRNRSDGSANRAARQREMLMAMLDRVKSKPVTQWKATLGRMLELCHTTLSFDELWETALWALEESPTIETLSLPTAELNAWGGILDDERGWVRVYDLEAASVLLHEFIYETDGESESSSEETAAASDKTETTDHATPDQDRVNNGKEAS